MHLEPKAKKWGGTADSGALFHRRGPHLTRSVSCCLRPLPAARRGRPLPLCLPASASRRPQPTWEGATLLAVAHNIPVSCVVFLGLSRCALPQGAVGLFLLQWSTSLASSCSDETPRTVDGATGHSERWEGRGTLSRKREEVGGTVLHDD